MTIEPSGIGRRRAVRAALLGWALTLGTLALAPLAAAEDRYAPAPPEPGTDIPAATIKFGMRPYADNTFYIIGMKKGWYNEVGITFEPAPYGSRPTTPT